MNPSRIWREKEASSMYRRDFAKTIAGAMAGLVLTRQGIWAAPTALAFGLSDPQAQPKFMNPVPDALAPGFIYQPDPRTGEYNVAAAMTRQATGLIDPGTGKALKTWLFGYGDPSDGVYTWPGRTFQIRSFGAGGSAETVVNWTNGLNPVREHLLPVDTNVHWCYSLPGYTQNTIASAGVPIITHLHGGHTDYQFDGNPEFFYGPGGRNRVIGPQWANVPGGFTTRFRYDNDVPAGNLWYHDHALGITRLNVYAGLAGFYFVRDSLDTGYPVGSRGRNPGNTLGLPAWPYEKAYAIQDRMFLDTGELFYPAFPGDPFYDDFINGEGAVLPTDLFPGGGPTALAEFFGDHMVVNGVIWPYELVEPRNYRLHLLNGCDSRFMAIRFREVSPGGTDPSLGGAPIPFTVIGSDQGLASQPTVINNYLLFEPGSRYDLVFDFSQVTFGNRVIMENIGSDAPFGGEVDENFGDFFANRQTNRVMAFDVAVPFGTLDRASEVTPVGISFGPDVGTPNRTRKVALFEGRDEFGRLQPLLGTAEPATDYMGNPINWPDTPEYVDAELVGQMEGSLPWHSPTTENPAVGATEEWEIWNFTGDAHPIHLHLVHFEVLGRVNIKFDSEVVEDGFIPMGATPANDGVYLVPQVVVQHGGGLGDGFRVVQPSDPADGYGSPVFPPAGYVENTPKDMVIALPGQITRIKATFDKPGRYVWHCHILSHEDHEMMRVLHVGPGA